jgi:5-oxopent-3-ene-1,2,5-tricarboxylate decarboxylase/2-hydroxyhepta-2,4-diene-1,7-dioate isomerase
MKKYALLIVFVCSVATVGAQKPWDQNFKPDIEPPDGFRTNRTSYSAIMDVLDETREDVTLEQLAQLEDLQLENIWASMGEYEDNYVVGFQTTRPGERIIGRALTIRSLPSRPDLNRALETLGEEGDWDTRFYVRAGEEASPGDVVVVDLGGPEGHIFFGDITAMGIQMRGARGVIIDGGTRDLEELSEDTFEGFPVFARFFDPVGPRWLDAEYNVPIRVGGATVLPGDVVVAEDEAMLFFPAAILDDVVQGARNRQELEDYERNMLKEKKYRIRDVYPLHPDLRKEYEDKKKSTTDDP